VLDLQPGRSRFLEVAKRWRWALERPWVGLALDPEWRMDAGQVPGETIGQVRATEVNRVSRWLQRIAVSKPPQKSSCSPVPPVVVISIEFVVTVRLAMVQHVDGRTRRSGAYRTVAGLSSSSWGSSCSDGTRPHDAAEVFPDQPKGGSSKNYRGASRCGTAVPNVWDPCPLD
jgi:hypothetical protein